MLFLCLSKSDIFITVLKRRSKTQNLRPLCVQQFYVQQQILYYFAIDVLPSYHDNESFLSCARL